VMSSVVPNAKRYKVIKSPNRPNDNGRLLTSQCLSQSLLKCMNQLRNHLPPVHTDHLDVLSNLAIGTLNDTLSRSTRDPLLFRQLRHYRGGAMTTQKGLNSKAHPHRHS